MQLSRSAVLAVIDMQNVFADPGSDWFTPGFSQILQPILELTEAFAGRTVFTRFLAPAEPGGAWRAYYQQWPFALKPAEWAGYRLVDVLDRPGLVTMDTSTFGKWTPRLAELVSDEGELVLAGVSTDCCVLSTALAAADAGVRVLVAEQACAGLDTASHQRALAAMRMYAPLIEVVSVDDLVRAARPGEASR
jgi:nicotinamidase-related amidase